MLRTVEERGVRFVQMWFTDVLGHPQVLPDHPGRARERPGRGHDVRRVDHRRLQPGAGERRARHARRQDLPAPSVPGGWPPRLRGSSATSSTSTARRSRATPGTCSAGPWSGHARSVSPSSWLPSSSTSTSHPPSDPTAGAPPVPLDRGSYFDLTTNDLASELRRETVLTLEDMGIPVEYSQHEDAPSQHEIDLRYTDALTMADTVMTVRMVVKEIAARNGVMATFMPKPLPGFQGSGMHTHMSLFDGAQQRVLRRRRRVQRLSQVARQLHRRHARPRQGADRGHQPVGQLLQAPDHRLRGARCTSRGPATTARPWSGSHRPRRARGTRPGSSTGRPTPPPTPYLAFRRGPGRGTGRDREGLRAARRGRGQPLRAVARPAPLRSRDRDAARVPVRGGRRPGAFRA